jgi:hypothetical protein
MSEDHGAGMFGSSIDRTFDDISEYQYCDPSRVCGSSNTEGNIRALDTEFSDFSQTRCAIDRCRILQRSNTLRTVVRVSQISKYKKPACKKPIGQQDCRENPLSPDRGGIGVAS